MPKETTRFLIGIAIFSHIAVLSEGDVFCEENGSLTPRIVNGRLAEKGEYPWAMAILKSYRLICVFSLISEQTAMGAAHCYYNFRNNVRQLLEGRIGGTLISKARKVYFSKSITAPGYNYSSNLNDLGLLILTEKIKITQKGNIRTVPLPLELRIYHEGIANVAGWGRLSNDTYISTNELRVAEVNIVRCNFSDLTPEEASTLIMAGTQGKGTAKGDSGTALIYGEGSQRMAIGVASVGSKGSAILGKPTYFTSTGYFAKWIGDHASGNVTFLDP